MVPFTPVLPPTTLSENDIPSLQEAEDLMNRLALEPSTRQIPYYVGDIQANAEAL